MEARYSSIGKTITVRFNTSELNDRDKVHLLYTLLLETGITQAMYTDEYAGKYFDRVWQAKTEDLWKDSES